MKKKLSRLLCVLLVLTMVCAMVPAVSADDKPGTLANNPIIMYVGDYSSYYNDLVPDCPNTAHSRTVTYTGIYGDASDTPTTSATYVSYDSSSHTFRALAPTIKTIGGKLVEGVVKAEITCSTTGCTEYKGQTRYYKVYSKAQGITLKNSGGTTLTSLSLSKGAENEETPNYDQKIYYTLNPATMNPKNIKVTFRNTAIKAETNEDGTLKTDSNSYGTFFKVSVAKGGLSTKMDITLDDGTKHTPVTKTYDVVTDSAAALTLKSGNTVLATSTDDGDSSYEYDIGDTISITATADSVLGKVADIEWASSDSDMAGFVGTASNGTIKLKINKAGTSLITASLGGATAQFKVRALKNVTSVEILDSTGYSMEDQEVNVNSKTLTASVSAKPTKYADAAQYTVWSISDTDILDFDAPTKDDMYKSGTTWLYKWTIDPDTGDATGNKVRFKALRAGTVTVKVKLGDCTDSFRVTVKKAATTIKIKEIPIRELTATVRRGTASEIVDRLNNNSMYRQIAAVNSDNKYVYVPVEWISAQINGNQATVRGQAVTSDNENNYDYTCTTGITATVKLTDDAAVTNITISSSKDTAVENDVVRLTANATVEPTSATATYQWYVNGRAIDKATSTTLNYTIPKASVDSSTQYKFTCEVTATYKKNSTVSTSKAYTVSVDREYSVSVETTSSKSSFTVGDKIDLKATLYRLGSAQSSSAFSWQLFDSNGDNLSSNIATVSGSGATATVTTKAVKSAKGEKIVVRATSDYKGYSSSETITVLPAEAASVSQSVGSGDTIKASAITSAVTKAAGSNANVSYVIFDTTRSCTLSKSSSSSSSVVDEKCYISGSGLKLSEVYVKTSASTASASYVAYDADDYVLATGTISFDTNETSETLSFSGATLKTCGGVSQIADEYPNASYVKFDLPKDTEAKLYFDYAKIASYGREVKSSDKFYLDAGKNDDSVEDVFVLPVYGAAGTLKIYYTAYSSSNSDLGTGTITLTVKSKTASSKFTDVTSSNTGYWSADSIDFGVDNGLFSGKSTYRFDPEGAMDRGMLVTVLYRAAGEPSVSGISNPFTDVKQKDYFYNAVLWAYKNKVVTGTSADKFSPSANVTREQIATILYRYMGEPTATGSLSGYSDRAKVSSYATTAMQWAIGKGYITGTTKTTLSPDGKATRAQVAVMLHRFLTF